MLHNKSSNQSLILGRSQSPELISLRKKVDHSQNTYTAMQWDVIKRQTFSLFNITETLELRYAGSEYAD